MPTQEEKCAAIEMLINDLKARREGPPSPTVARKASLNQRIGRLTLKRNEYGCLGLVIDWTGLEIPEPTPGQIEDVVNLQKVVARAIGHDAQFANAIAIADVFLGAADAWG